MRPSSRIALALLASSLLATPVAGCGGTRRVYVAPRDTVAQSADRRRFELEKLQFERNQAQADLENAQNPLLRYSGLVSTVIVVLGALGGFLKYLAEQRAARQHEALERFNAALAQFGDEDVHARIPAAISLEALATADEKKDPARVRLVIDSVAGHLGQTPGAGEQAVLANVLSRLVARSKDVLASLPLADADLRNVSFAGAKLAGTNFDRCKLEATSFKGAELKRCTFSMVTSPDDGAVDFSGAALDTVTFAEVTLHHGSFAGAEMKEVVFKKCTLAQCSFHGLRAGSSLTFRGGNLLNADFADAQIAALTMDATADVDTVTLRSLAGAPGIDTANVDAATKAKIAGAKG